MVVRPFEPADRDVVRSDQPSRRIHGRARPTALRQVGSPGCHLGSLLANDGAIAFFQRMGFERFGVPILAPGMRSPTGGRHHLQFMVRDT
jgi:hypothetical protein